MTTRCFHVALHTNESETQMTVDNPPGAGYAMVSQDTPDAHGAFAFIWRLLDTVLPAPPAPNLTLKSNDVPEPYWAAVPEIFVSDDPPTVDDGVNGDIWVEY